MFAIRFPARRICPQPASLNARVANVSFDSALLARICEFLQAQKAFITDVSESSIHLAVGRSLPVRWKLAGSRQSLAIDIIFESSGSHGDSDTTAAITIRPTTTEWTHSEFAETAKRLMWHLQRKVA